MEKNIKKDVLKYLFAVVCIVFTFAFGYVAAKLAPQVVSYSIAGQNNISKTVSMAGTQETDDALFDNVKLIPEQGEYVIKSIDDKICVFCDNTAVYKIKANLGDFPANDVFLLREGMAIPNKDEVCRIVGYMES